MVTKIAKKLELKFWDAMIPFLSNSPWLRAVTGRFVKYNDNGRIFKLVLLGGIVAFFGFISGFIYFSLSTLFS
jgi:hypothetical protein